MVDAVLGLNTLEEGDPLGYIIQNQANLVLARLAVDPRAVNDTVVDPGTLGTGTVFRGDMYVVGAAGGTASTLWEGQTAGTLAIALSDDPQVASGWYFYVPKEGTRIWNLAGTLTGHLVHNGTAFVAV